MWLRNLLFIGVVVGSALLVRVQLFPPRPVPIAVYANPAYQADDFRAAVQRVDATFSNDWDNEKLRTAMPADDLTIARRLALGLMGTVPSLEEVRQFEALPAEQRLDWWLDRILADRRHAEYFGERFARAFVGTEDGPFIFYRRRRFVNWLADEFAVNRPYDKIVRETIAAEGLWTSKPASNFISVTAQKEDRNQPDPVRLAGRVMRAFLGIRLDCAQCHDHPFAAWKRSDFENLSAFFGQTHLGFTGIYNARVGEYETLDRKTMKPRYVLPKVPFSPELLPTDGTRRVRLARWVTDAGNPYFARAAVNRVWALMLGRPLIDPVDSIEVETTPPALLVLANDFAAHGYDLRRLIRVIAATRVFRMDSAADFEPTTAEEEAWSVFPLTRLRPEQVVGGILQAASVATIDSESHVIVRLAGYAQHNQFLERYGDVGEDEFSGRGGTIPQRLLMMNGELIQERIKDGPFNAATQIAALARGEGHGIEPAYLAVLTRRPTPAEVAYFSRKLADPKVRRTQSMEDLFWSLLNSTEFSWNH